MPIIPASSKVILVTGASKGIGLAISRYLLRDNENYVVAIARTVDTLEELRLQHPHNIMPVQDDLADFSIAKKAVDLALEQWGRIEGIVVNHAVATPISTVADCDVEEWRKAFDIIFFSAVALTQSAVPSLRYSHGRIIFVSSGSAKHASGGLGAYGSSKAALHHLVLTLTAEEPDIISMSIAPGVVDTQMQTDMREIYASLLPPQEAKVFAGYKEQGHLVTPEKPGHVLARLVCEADTELRGEFLAYNSPYLDRYQE